MRKWLQPHGPRVQPTPSIGTHWVPVAVWGQGSTEHRCSSAVSTAGMGEWAKPGLPV